jgi:hypothetical protein
MVPYKSEFECGKVYQFCYLLWRMSSPDAIGENKTCGLWLVSLSSFNFLK